MKPDLNVVYNPRAQDPEAWGRVSWIGTVSIYIPNPYRWFMSLVHSRQRSKGSPNFWTMKFKTKFLNEFKFSCLHPRNMGPSVLNQDSSFWCFMEYIPSKIVKQISCRVYNISESSTYCIKYRSEATTREIVTTIVGWSKSPSIDHWRARAIGRVRALSWMESYTDRRRGVNVCPWIPVDVGSADPSSVFRISSRKSCFSKRNNGRTQSDVVS